MSVPPDYMQLNPDLGLGPQMSPLSMSWQQNLQGMLGNPQTMGLAAALLQASGPSRMPTSLGSALGSGIMYGPQYEQQGLQNQMQKLMLGQTIAKMNYMLNPPGQNQSPQQQTSQTAQAGNPGIGLTSSPQDINNALMTGSTQSSQASPASVDTTSMSPQQMVTAPSTVSDPMQDPYYNYLAGGARIGLPGWDTLAGQRQTFLLAEPSFQAAQAAAKAQVTPINVRQGGGVYIPGRGLVYQLPKLPTGATIDANGNVSMAPGSLPAIGKSEQAEAQGSLFGKPAEGVIPSGPNAGGKYQSTVGNLMFGNNGGMPPLTLLPPAQTGGMADAGKAATDRANVAIEKQQSAQQTVAQLGQLQSNLEALGTGPGKETQLEVKKGLSAIGGFFGFPGLANADLTNAAAARKSIVNLTAPMVRSMGAREPFQMVSFIKDGMASISNPQDANQVVLGMLRGIAEYQNDTGKFAGNWLNKNNGAGFSPGSGAWDANWQKQADPGAYIFENLPTFEQQAILNAAQKNPALLAEVQRMARSQKLLKSQGFMLQDNQ